jgi:two-component system sensor histidine kinase RegB
MPTPNSVGPLPSTANLRRLFVLRNIEIGGQALAVGVATQTLAIALPLPPLLAVIGFLALCNGLTWWRLKQPWPVSDLELFGQLLLDVAALAGLLYFSGGSTNPFVSLFLLPLTIAAATLAPRYTWSMAALAVGCYTLLMFNYVPLPPSGAAPTSMPPMVMEGAASGHMQMEHGFGLHVLGMWFNFLVSALLIAFFVVRMAASIRERDGLLARAREDALRHEQIIALGTLAAGAAHELGTPLSTMAVVIKELQYEVAAQPDVSDSLATLREQVDQCKGILSRLLASADHARAEGGERRPVDAFLDELLDKWSLMRPGIRASVHWDGVQPAPHILAEQTLFQALMNLLNNAADASPAAVEVEGRWSERELHLEIRDRGPGLTPDAMQRAGTPFFTTKPPEQGFGLGLFLANASIERCNGKVRLFNRDGGGACVDVTLPLLAPEGQRHP